VAVRTALLVALGAVVAVGCSDDDDGPGVDTRTDAAVDGSTDGGIGNDVAPEKIPGGGTAGGSIDGRVNVYVIDAETDEPLEGALVMLGDGTTDQGSADKDGLVTFRRPGLKGPVTLTAGMAGYTTSTVVGLDAANVTLTLDTRSPAPVPTGTCSGTVKDWDQLPPVAQNHVRLGFAGFLLGSELGSPANEVDQPPGNLNLYAPGPPFNQDSWVVTLAAGDSVGVYLLVLDVDTKGTQDDTDDERTLTHVGLARNLKVDAGKALTGVELSLVPVDKTLKLKLPALPAGTDTQGVGVLVELASGQLMPVLFDAGGMTEFPVPGLGGDFTGGNYWVMLSAQQGSQDDDRASESTLIKRNITDLSATVEGTLLELPSGIKLEGRTLSFVTPSVSMAAANLLPQTSGEAYWSVAFVAPAAAGVSYTLPALPQGAKVEPLPTGKLVLQAEAVDIPGVDLNNVKFKQLVYSMARSAQHAVTVELN
jgi:hypothetical protein